MPPDAVTTAITTRRALVWTDGQKYPAPRGAKILGNLRAGVSRSDHEHCAIWKMVWAAVLAGVHDKLNAIDAHRSYRDLIGTGRDNHVLCFDAAIRRI